MCKMQFHTHHLKKTNIPFEERIVHPTCHCKMDRCPWNLRGLAHGRA